MDDFEDRVTCDTCPYMGTREASENLHKDQVLKSRRLGHKVELPGDVVTKRGQWLTLTWQESYCTKTGQVAMPKGVKHRCLLVKQEQSVQTEQEWWE